MAVSAGLSFLGPSSCMQPHPQGSRWGRGGVLGRPLVLRGLLHPAQGDAVCPKPPEEGCRLEGPPRVQRALPAVLAVGTCSALGKVGMG